MGFNAFWNLLYGGEEIGGVFWFVSVLLLTRLIFLFFYQKINIVIIVISLIIASAESIFLYLYNFISFPLNLDVLLLSVPYYFIGFHFKEKILQKKNIMPSILFFVLFIFLQKKGIIDYALNMSHSDYYNPILTVSLPISAFIPLYFLSKFLSGKRLFSCLLENMGKYSLVIMYLHLMPMMFSIKKESMIFFIMIGIFFPLLLSISFQEIKKRVPFLYSFFLKELKSVLKNQR